MLSDYHTPISKTGHLLSRSKFAYVAAKAGQKKTCIVFLHDHPDILSRSNFLTISSAILGPAISFARSLRISVLSSLFIMPVSTITIHYINTLLCSFCPRYIIIFILNFRVLFIYPSKWSVRARLYPCPTPYTFFPDLLPKMKHLFDVKGRLKIAGQCTGNSSKGFFESDHQGSKFGRYTHRYCTYCPWLQLLPIHLLYLPSLWSFNDTRLAMRAERFAICSV